VTKMACFREGLHNSKRSDHPVVVYPFR